MKWTTDVSDALYLNFAVNEEEVDRLLPPETTVDTRLHRGEPWGFFSLILYRHESLKPGILPWPSFSFPQANLRIYVKDENGTSAVYFKRLYMPGFYGTCARFYAKQPVRTMSMNWPSSVHQGGEYRWRLSGSGQGNISGKVGEDAGISGDLVNLFNSKSDAVEFFRRRSLAYYSAGMDHVYRLNVRGNYGAHHSFRVREWELGFLAEDLERHNFPEAMSSNFLCPDMSFEFDSPAKVPLSELTRV